MSQTNHSPKLLARWTMSEGKGSAIGDSSGSGLDLVASTTPDWTSGPSDAFGAIRFRDPMLHLASGSGPIRTNESFSVAAWVRLDSETTGPTPSMPKDSYAWTAVAQSGEYHSPFYLGVRYIEYGGEGTGDFHLHFNFTVAPIDGSDDGPVDWVHAYSELEISSADVDRWVLLVAVYDLEEGAARLYVPTRGDSGEQSLPLNWPKWHGAENFQLGHAWFRDEFVDRWPGSIGPVWVYDGVLAEGDALSFDDAAVAGA